MRKPASGSSVAEDPSAGWPALPVQRSRGGTTARASPGGARADQGGVDEDGCGEPDSGLLELERGEGAVRAKTKTMTTAAAVTTAAELAIESRTTSSATAVAPFV